MTEDKKNDLVISQEAAEEQLNLFLNYYDIDLEDTGNDKDLARANRSVKNKIIRAVRKGLVEFKEEDDTLNVYQNLTKPLQGVTSPIKYKEPTGHSKIAMKESENTDQYGKMYNLLGGMSGEGKKPFLQMKGKDLSIAESLALLFLDI